MEPHVNEAPVHADLGQALWLSGRAREAIPHLEKAIEKMPGDAYLRRVLHEARRSAETRS